MQSIFVPKNFGKKFFDDAYFGEANSETGNIKKKPYNGGILRKNLIAVFWIEKIREKIFLRCLL